MASTQEVCAQLVDDVSDCLAVGVVDLNTGMLMGVHHTVPYFTQAYLDAVAAATADLFQGQNVTAIEKLFRRSRGQDEDGKHYFNEIVVFSENLLHVFLRSKKHRDQAAVVVCRGSANIGMVLSKSRTSLAEIEAAA